jgi:hypothetical protein
MGLGRVEVSSLKRVPNPPASMTAFIKFLKSFNWLLSLQKHQNKIGWKVGQPQTWNAERYVSLRQNHKHTRRPYLSPDEPLVLLVVHNRAPLTNKGSRETKLE